MNGLLFLRGKMDPKSKGKEGEQEGEQEARGRWAHDQMTVRTMKIFESLPLNQVMTLGSGHAKNIMGGLSEI